MKKTLCFLFIVIVIGAYFYFANTADISYSKIDTLFMVSTIFFSAVIGMVISNNIHLNNEPHKKKIRNLYKIMRQKLTVFFFFTTFFYFILDITFFVDLSNLMGINLNLLTLCIIILFIAYNLLLMRDISQKIAYIEDDDSSTNSIQLRQQKILDLLQDNDGQWLSKTALLKGINVNNSKENEKNTCFRLLMIRR